MSNYSLQKYKGTSTRHTCPNCGDRRSFATTWTKAVRPSPVGRQMQPRKRLRVSLYTQTVFSTTPECRTAGGFSSGRQCMAQKLKQPLQQTAIGYIPPHYVEKSQSVHSNFCRFLQHCLIPITAARQRKC